MTAVVFAAPVTEPREGGAAGLRGANGDSATSTPGRESVALIKVVRAA